MDIVGDSILYHRAPLRIVDGIDHIEVAAIGIQFVGIEDG